MILQTREEMGRGGTDSEHSSQRFGIKRSNNLEAVFFELRAHGSITYSELENLLGREACVGSNRTPPPDMVGGPREGPNPFLPLAQEKAQGGGICGNVPT